MNLRVNEWFGRLGNNIIQVKNAIQIALYYKYNIIIPKHTYFNTTYIVINDTIKQNDKTITVKHDFFYPIKLNPSEPNVFEMNIDETLNILKKIFITKTVTPLDENSVVIHIRSGDLFNKVPHPAYLPPPLSYYTTILNNSNFSTIYLIAEDRRNPIITELQKLYPTIKFKLQSLDDDIKLLLGSKTVIESFGTFTPSLLIVSNNITTIYRPSYQISNTILENMKHKINIQEINLSNYKKQMTPWKNTKKQQECLLNYKII